MGLQPLSHHGFTTISVAYAASSIMVETRVRVRVRARARVSARVRVRVGCLRGLVHQHVREGVRRAAVRQVPPARRDARGNDHVGAVDEPALQLLLEITRLLPRRRMRSRLQPYAVEAATLCDGGCNPMRWRLQPYAVEAVTLCGRGCNAVHPDCNPVSLARLLRGCGASPLELFDPRPLGLPG